MGWRSTIGSRGQVVLDTLFLKLDHPARKINIEGLPENVVPLMKIKKKKQLNVHFQMVFQFQFFDHKFMFYQILQ